MQTPRTQSELLALLARLQDPEYHASLLAGSGGELLYAIAAMFARVSSAVAASYDGLTPGTARLGAYAYGYVELTRTADGGYPAGSLEVGTMLWSVTGERVLLLESAVWPALDASSRVVQVQSQRRSAQANLAVGTVLAMKSPVPSPAFDTTIMGTVYDAGLGSGGIATGIGLAGGSTPMLDTLVSDHRMMPRFGESEARLRDRFRDVPDTVAPGAILRQARIEVPGAVLTEIADSAFAFNFSAVDQSWDLSAPNAGDRIYSSIYPVNQFAVTVPRAIATGFPLAVGFGAVEFDAFAPAMPGLAPDGSCYDVGSPGMRPEIARLSARVDAAKPAGVAWHIEEEV